MVCQSRVDPAREERRSLLVVRTRLVDVCFSLKKHVGQLTGVFGNVPFLTMEGERQ